MDLAPRAAVDAHGTDRAFPIPATDSVNIDRGTSMILVRLNGHVFAMSLSCPHEHAAVKWVTKDARFRCTKHDSQYLPDGEYISGRATRHLDRFPIRRDGDRVIVTLDVVFRSDLDAAGWAAADVAL
jgi:nitrite reductase/ring-hydroxylating ferredoxin subunit